MEQWFGWIWARGGWQRVCCGDSLGQCGRRLAREARRWKVTDKLTVMTGGGTPAYVPRFEEGANRAGARPTIRVKPKGGRKTVKVSRPPKPPAPRPPDKQ
jgi:hypothetical protein